MVASWAAARSAETFFIKVPTRGKKKKKKKKKKSGLRPLFFSFSFSSSSPPLGGRNFGPKVSQPSF